jgi:DNA-binding protein HU-beta
MNGGTFALTEELIRKLFAAKDDANVAVELLDLTRADLAAAGSLDLTDQERRNLEKLAGAVARRERAAAAASPVRQPKRQPLSKNAVLEAVAKAVGEEIRSQQVKQVVESLVAVGHRELKRNGVFVLHGFAKFVVVKKPSRASREGINPFTKEKQRFAAKPAKKGVRARPVKAIKDAVE